MARRFFITRVSADSEDPTALEFFPPKGSDELHEALKEAFPLETNLSARMRQAVIEFLLQEQHVEQSMSSVSPEYLPSPQSSFVSTMPSPAMPFTPIQSEISQSRRQSTAQPSQHELMDVWTLPNKPAAKIHTRRSMTAEEKKAYKQKRLVGACADCKRRRRKCDHNTTSTSPAQGKVGKVKKRTSAPETASKPAVASVPEIPSHWTHPNFTFDTDMMAMPAGFDTEMSAFDFDASGFDMTPDLDKDWALFPEINNQHYVDFSGTQASWPAENAMFDTSFFSNRATEQLASAHERAAFAPATPLSMSPISRSQSSNGLSTQPDPFSYDTNNSHDLFAGLPNMSVSNTSFHTPDFSPASSTVSSMSSFDLPEGNPRVPSSSMSRTLASRSTTSDAGSHMSSSSVSPSDLAVDRHITSVSQATAAGTRQNRGQPDPLIHGSEQDLHDGQQQPSTSSLIRLRRGVSSETPADRLRRRLAQGLPQGLNEALPQGLQPPSLFTIVPTNPGTSVDKETHSRSVRAQASPTDGPTHAGIDQSCQIISSTSPTDTQRRGALEETMSFGGTNISQDRFSVSGLNDSQQQRSLPQRAQESPDNARIGGLDRFESSTLATCSGFMLIAVMLTACGLSAKSGSLQASDLAAKVQVAVAAVYTIAALALSKASPLSWTISSASADETNSLSSRQAAVARPRRSLRNVIQGVQCWAGTRSRLGAMRATSALRW